MPDKETIPAIRKEMDVEMLLEIKQVLSFKETNVELAHRQQLIKFLFELYHHLSPLLEEKERRIKELSEWKESAISVMPDYQAIGKEMGIRLGDSIHDKILPAIKNLKERVKELEGAQIL